MININPFSVDATIPNSYISFDFATIVLCVFLKNENGNDIYKTQKHTVAFETFFFGL